MFDSQQRELTTRRERPKSALNLRLEKRKVFKIEKGDLLGFLKLQFVAKHEKIEGAPFENI